MIHNERFVKHYTRQLILVAVLTLSGLTACLRQDPPAPAPFFIGAAAALQSESKPPALPQSDNSLSFDHITLEDGLSQSTVNSIVQDDQGFMWFATNNGLNRYDGYDLTIFKHDPSDSSTIADNIVQSLLVDSEGTLWVGTEGSGLDRFDRDLETFTHFAHDENDLRSLSSDFIYSLYEDQAGMIWVGALDGLNRFDPTTGEFTHYPNELISGDDSVAANLVVSTFEDPHGVLWLGTLGGLFSFDPNTETISAEPLPPNYSNNPISSFYQDQAGDLWIGTFNDGAYHYQFESGEVTVYHQSPVKLDSLSNNTVRGIAEDNSGNLWIATDGGLNWMPPGANGFVHEQHNPQKPESLSENITPSFYIDRSGIIWSGTFTRGINKFDPFKAKFGHVKQDPDDPEKSLIDNLVISFLKDSRGDFWIGTYNGLQRKIAETGEVVHYTAQGGILNTLQNSVVTDLLEDKFGNIWIATQGGLDKYVPDSSNFVAYRYEPINPDSLNFPVLQDLYEDSNGDLWIGTAGGGFDQFNYQTDTFIHHEFDEIERIDNVGPDNVRKFLEDSQGQFWIGTMAGLGLFDRDTGEMKYFSHDPSDPDSLSDNYVLSLLEDSAGGLWVGTQNGINLFLPETGTFKRYLTRDGLPDNVIYGMLEDDQGNLWISTNRGISRFSPSTGEFHNFDTGDGLQGLEYNINAYYRDDEGQMYFGGVNGFNQFFPDEITDNPYIPPVIVTGFQIDNEEVDYGEDSVIEKPISQLDSLELGRADTSISFELASLHFSSPEDNQYAYIMEGFDEDWNYIGSRRFATYTKLPPGEYTFRAIGSNSDGVWNLEGTSINVSVPIPFWRTWWFLTLVALLLVASVYGAFRLRIRSAEARTRELEHQVERRTSEADKRREIAEGLREILIILNSSRSLVESLHYIVDQAAGLTEAEDAIIFRQRDSSQMEIVATNQGGQIRYTPGPALLLISMEWITGALSEFEPLVLPDLETYWEQHPDITPRDLSVHKALLGVPLRLGEEIYGGLLMFYTAKRDFTPDDLELGLTFADQAALAIANDRLRARAEETAVASERNRLARDLHDAVTQTLFSASLIAETLPLIYENDAAEGMKLLQELRQLTRGALAEMRTLLLELRPMALEESELPDLLLQLSEAVTGRTGIPITTSIQRPCSLPTNVRIALYRIAQESLNNVMKHARATEVNLELAGCAPGKVLVLSVRDNGRGYDMDAVPSDRMGLTIISERAAAIGAELEMESEPGVGTSIHVYWRADEEEE